MIVLLFSLLAPAADLPKPTVDQAKDGTITATVQLDEPVEVVRANMQDPGWLPKVTGSSTQVTVTGMDGTCQLVSSVSPNAIMTAKYQTRRCPTASGFASTLRDSNCFDRYRTSWSFQPSGAGTLATYVVSLDTSLWVPNSVVRRTTRSEIAKMLGKLQDWSLSQ